MTSETRLAKASRRRADLRDPDKNYNKMTQEQLDSLAPSMDWKRFFIEAGWQKPGKR